MRAVAIGARSRTAPCSWRCRVVPLELRARVVPPTVRSLKNENVAVHAVRLVRFAGTTTGFRRLVNSARRCCGGGCRA